MVLKVIAEGAESSRDAGPIDHAEMLLQRHPAGRPWTLSDLDQDVASAAQIGADSTGIGAGNSTLYAMQLHALLSVGPVFTLHPNPRRS